MQEKQSCRGNILSAEETEKCNSAKKTPVGNMHEGGGRGGGAVSAVHVDGG